MVKFSRLSEVMRLERAPDILVQAAGEQRAARLEKLREAKSATTLHRKYKESGAQFLMTFAEFKRRVRSSSKSTI